MVMVVKEDMEIATALPRLGVSLSKATTRTPVHEQSSKHKKELAPHIDVP